MDIRSTVIGALILSAALLISFRWEIIPSQPIVRLDRWTGDFEICLPKSDGHYVCGLK